MNATIGDTHEWQRNPLTPAEAAEFDRIWKKKAKFLIDESLGIGFADILHAHGFNAAYADEVGLLNHSDEDYVSYAWRKDRILLTHDTGFWDDYKFPLRLSPGIVILPGASGSHSPLLKSLQIVTYSIGLYRDRWRFAKVKIEIENEYIQLTIKNINQSGHKVTIQKRGSPRSPVVEREISRREKDV